MATDKKRKKSQPGCRGEERTGKNGRKKSEIRNASMRLREGGEKIEMNSNRETSRKTGLNGMVRNRENTHGAVMVTKKEGRGVEGDPEKDMGGDGKGDD